MVSVAASLLAANFNNLNEELIKLEKTKIEWLHYDVMDGVFVNNISFGPSILKQLNTKLFKDVHLMIVNPQKYIKEFVDAKADLITFHYEAVKKEELNDLINLIKSYNVKVGISIKPNTEVNAIEEYLKDLDLLLVMSVEPGFGGQVFNESSIEKIKKLRKIIDNNNYKCLIEVDGGINDVTSKLVKDAGVDVMVAGSYIFNSEDYNQRVNSLLDE